MANTILIVDDDRATRDELAQLLAHEGYETLTASDVPTAMHILSASAPDLLITEIRLDTYNGLHIIAMAPTPIPAIVLTGIADPVIEADARRFLDLFDERQGKLTELSDAEAEATGRSISQVVEIWLEKGRVLAAAEQALLKFASTPSPNPDA